MDSHEIHLTLPAPEISLKNLKSSFCKKGGGFFLIGLSEADAACIVMIVQIRAPYLFLSVHLCLDLIHGIHKDKNLRNHLVKLRRNHLSDIQS